MKTMIFLSLSLSLIGCLLCSCGGAIGNIEKYPFPGLTKEKLRVALEKVYTEYPELQKTDTSMYGMNDGNDFYFVLDKDQNRFIFKCHVIAYTRYKTELSLTTATTWGDTMELAPSISFFKKRRYRKLFEEHIFPKIKEQLE